MKRRFRNPKEGTFAVGVFAGTTSDGVGEQLRGTTVLQWLMAQKRGRE
jgi:hypothetical protein